MILRLPWIATCHCSYFILKTDLPNIQESSSCSTNVQSSVHAIIEAYDQSARPGVEVTEGHRHDEWGKWGPLCIWADFILVYYNQLLTVSDCRPSFKGFAPTIS